MKGIALKMFCSECKVAFSTEKSEEFYHCFICKHIFHANCIKDRKCTLCTQPDSYQSFKTFYKNYNISIKFKKVDDIIYSARKKLTALTDVKKKRESPVLANPEVRL